LPEIPYWFVCHMLDQGSSPSWPPSLTVCPACCLHSFQSSSSAQHSVLKLYQWNYQWRLLPAAWTSRPTTESGKQAPTRVAGSRSSHHMISPSFDIYSLLYPLLGRLKLLPEAACFRGHGRFSAFVPGLTQVEPSDGSSSCLSETTVLGLINENTCFPDIRELSNALNARTFSQPRSRLGRVMRASVVIR